jgi:hypothetical protein
MVILEISNLTKGKFKTLLLPDFPTQAKTRLEWPAFEHLLFLLAMGVLLVEHRIHLMP